MAREQILEQNWLSMAEIETLFEEVSEQVEEATSLAQGEPSPSPVQDDWAALQSSHLIEGNANWNR